MIDLAALITELEINSRYDATVRSGNNTGTTTLLSELEPNKVIILSVPADDVKEAIGDGIRTLSANQIQVLRLFVGEGSVDFRRPAIRQEIRQIFNGNTAVLDRLTAIATRPRTYGEAFGGQPSLNDVRAAVKQITKWATE